MTATAPAAPVAVVTGAAGGIGEASAYRLAEAGYAVALWDLDERAVSAAVDRIAARGQTASASTVDVTDAGSIRTALTATRESLGTPTAVVSAAGIMEIHPFLELPADRWARTLQVNLTGTFLLLQACAAAMVEDALPGAMVAVASVAARGPRADAADYAASKAGVVSVVQSAAVALASHGIRVNAVCPGMVNTLMTQRNAEGRARQQGATPEQIIAGMVATVPLGRLASPAEVAAVAYRLIGDDFGYVTGQAINVCGGLEFD